VRSCARSSVTSLASRTSSSAAAGRGRGRPQAGQGRHAGEAHPDRGAVRQDHRDPRQASCARAEDQRQREALVRGEGSAPAVRHRMLRIPHDVQCPLREQGRSVRRPEGRRLTRSWGACLCAALLALGCVRSRRKGPPSVCRTKGGAPLPSSDKATVYAFDALGRIVPSPPTRCVAAHRDLLRDDGRHRRASAGELPRSHGEERQRSRELRRGCASPAQGDRPRGGLPEDARRRVPVALGDHGATNAAGPFGEIPAVPRWWSSTARVGSSGSTRASRSTTSCAATCAGFERSEWSGGSSRRARLGLSRAPPLAHPRRHPRRAGPPRVQERAEQGRERACCRARRRVLGRCSPHELGEVLEMSSADAKTRGGDLCGVARAAALLRERRGGSSMPSSVSFARVRTSIRRFAGPAESHREVGAVRSWRA